MNNNIEIDCTIVQYIKILVITTVPCLFVCSSSFLESEAIFSETVSVTAAGGFGIRSFPKAKFLVRIENVNDGNDVGLLFVHVEICRVIRAGMVFSLSAIPVFIVIRFIRVVRGEVGLLCVRS